MPRQIEPIRARPRSMSELRRLNAGSWPKWLAMDRAEGQLLDEILHRFRAFELVVDDSEEGLVATGWGAAISWDGTLEDLPSGFSDALVRSAACIRGDAEPDTFVMLAAHVRPDMTWQRDDGTPFDPWLRTHHRLGARLIAPAPVSQSVRAPVSRWEEWTGLRFPASGEYAIPGGLSMLSIDRTHDVGTYAEPNVWVRHRDAGGAGPSSGR